ncbi:transposase [Anoxybacillus mongoliensis]|uniref:Transposase n=1 Tax=Anoxybacillus mongoliensis TaxID=452565 RepID=A0A7W8JBV4_9BACL|nr:transposase [Anoxybacillus mongoliensis]
MTTVMDREKAKCWVERMKAQLHGEKVEELASFLKYLTNVLQRVEPHKTEQLMSRLHQPQNVDELASCFEHLCELVIDVGENHHLTKMYKTSEVAKFMGVTVATVNNWIKEGKIKGTHKAGKNAHAKIPETALYITSSNEVMTIKEIASLYEKEQKQHLAQAEENELLETIQFFNKKYNGTYFKTLAKKDVFTPEEQRDASEWTYALKKVGLFNK